MPQIKKPSAGGSAEGFNGLNSKCHDAQHTIIILGCSQQNDPSRPFSITNQAGVTASSWLAQSFLPEAKGGNNEY